MIIINIFYELARQHTRIKGFRYGRTYEKGAGNDSYPLVWVDDPITGRAAGSPEAGRVLGYTVNVDFLGLPGRGARVPEVQAAAIDAGLSFAERLTQIRGKTGVTVTGFTFVTLRDYYDDDAAGARFTYTLAAANPVDRCADVFDPDKQFPPRADLPDFATDHPDGCAVFGDTKGLPNFRVI